MSKYIRHWLEEPSGIEAAGVERLLGGSGVPDTEPINSRWLGEQGWPVLANGNTIQRVGFGLTAVNDDPNRADVEIMQTFGGGVTLLANKANCVGARVSGTEAAPNGYFADLIGNLDAI